MGYTLVHVRLDPNQVTRLSGLNDYEIGATFKVRFRCSLSLAFHSDITSHHLCTHYYHQQRGVLRSFGSILKTYLVLCLCNNTLPLQPILLLRDSPRLRYSTWLVVFSKILS